MPEAIYQDSVSMLSWFSVSGEEDFEVFLPYKGMVTILSNSAKPSEPIVRTPSREGPMQAVSKKKTFKDYTILYLYI